MDYDDQVAERMISLKREKKEFEKVWCKETLITNPFIENIRFFQFLDAQGLKRNSSIWEKIDHTAIIDEFPMLSEHDIIRNITLGEEVAPPLFKRTWIILFIN